MHHTREHLLTDEAFRRRLAGVLRGQPSRVWLMKGNGVRLDVVCSLGTSQPAPVVAADKKNGFYLFTENVPESLMPVIHELFIEYCATRQAEPIEPGERTVPVRYRHHGHRARHRPEPSHPPAPEFPPRYQS
jgi:hypothetical protein